MATTVAPRPKGSSDLEAHLKSFDDVPLFMRDLKEEEDGQDTNNAIEALRTLAFEGPPNEVATNFKNEGNEYYLGKRFAEAQGFYTQGIEVEPTDQKLLETLYLNRAACHLELQNYGKTLRDTSSALGINPKSEKAFYRAARALLSLDKLEEALDCCDHALEIDDQNLAVQQLRAKVTARQHTIGRKEAERAERERRGKELALALKGAFLARGLWLETSPRPPDNPTPAHFDPESLSAASQPSIPLVGGSVKWTAPDTIRTPIIFPVVLLYPQYAQSDLVSQFHEDTTIGAHLDAMFPTRGCVPWDQRGEYISTNLVVFASTHRKRLLRIGRKLSLRQILDQGAKDPSDPKKLETRDGIVMHDGIVSLVVLPKGPAEEEWIATFKKDRDAVNLV